MLRNIVKFYFGATGRREAKRLKKYPREFHESFSLQQQFKLKKETDLSTSQMEIPLSQVMENNIKQKSPYKHLTKPHPLQIKKFLRSHYKRSIEEQKEEIQEKANDSIEDKTLKWKENMIMFDEAQKFKKILFKKEETERLVLYEQTRPQNYLPIEYLQQKGESEYVLLNQRQKEFTSTINQLQEQRIDRLLSGITPKNKSQQTDIFSNLIKSQILNLGPEIQQTINLQIDWIMNKKERKNEIANANIIVMDQNEDIVNELAQEILSKVDLEKVSIDQEALKQFYRDYLNFDVEKKFEMKKHLDSINQIQNYQTFVFEKFRDNDINLRYKDKKLEFWMMTQDETLNYIKYTISNSETLLKIVDTINQYPEQKSMVQAQLIQKLSTFRTPGIEKLKLIGDNRFRILIRSVISGLGELDNDYFSSTILAISQLHPSSIIQVYPRLGMHLQKKIVKGILKRIDTLSIDCMAMILRNLHNLPLSKSVLLQEKLMEKISSFDITTLYQCESFLQFSTFVYKNLQEKFADFHLQLLKKLPIFDNEFEFDQTTTMIAVRSMTNLAILGRVNEVSEQVDLLQKKFSYQISKMQSDNLSQIVVLLSLLPTKKELVKDCKKRIVTIINYKEQVQDQRDISIIAASLSKIDTKILYHPKLNLHEINLLQCIFSRSIFAPKSAQYIPYSKLLKSINSDLNNFTAHNLALIIQAYGALNYQNKLALLDLVYKGLNYDPKKFQEQQFQPLKMDELGIFIYAFTSMNMKNDTLDKMIDYFENLYLQNKDQRSNAIALSLYSMTLFNFYYQEINQAQLSIQTLYIQTNILQYLNLLPITIQISLLFSYLGNLSSKKFQIEDSDQLIKAFVEKINLIQAKDLLIEHRYVLSLCQLILDLLLKEEKIKNELLITQPILDDLVEYQQKITWENLEKIGTERYNPKQTIELFEEDLEKLKIPFKKQHLLIHKNIPFNRIEIFLPEKQIGIQFLSFSQLIQFDKGKNNDIQFSYTGKQLLMRKLSKDLLGIKMVYIIIEQYNRMTEQLKLDPEATLNFIKQSL